MRRPLRRPVFFVVLAAAALAGLAAGGLYRAATQVPPFYRQALAAQPATQKAAGRQFEQRALALHNDVRRGGRWAMRFTQDQINGWLAVELPVKFPGMLPQGISQPRVAVEPGLIHLAARRERGGVTTIVSLTGEVSLTAEPNEVAVRVRRVRAGSLPVPLGELLQEISLQAAEAGLPIRWTEFQGDPVALVRLPREAQLAEDCQVVLEHLEAGRGELLVAGRTAERRAKTETAQAGGPAAAR
jgi:uncharacterized protein (DUF2461 family)